MTKRRGRRADSVGKDASRSKSDTQLESSTAFAWVPLWGWALIFLVPLIVSELMFWNVGKVPSMIMFPIAWIGFWYVAMERSGWPILKHRKDNASSDNGD